MNATFRLGPSVLAGLVLASLFSQAAFGQNPRRSDHRMTVPYLINDLAASREGDRKRMQDAFKQGNFKDAYEGFRKLTLDPKDDPQRVGSDLNMAVQCLQQLNRIDEVDGLLEKAIAAHQTNWRLLSRTAEEYMRVPHYGFIVAGTFRRGPMRGGGRAVNAIERDRVRALQLMVQAMPSARKDDGRAEVGSYLLDFANVLLNNRGYGDSWRLQYLTDLAVLPDYEDGSGYYFHPTAGAPVGADGKPIFYHLPKGFEAAENDGQRWRWCLDQAAEINPQQRNSVRMRLAEFLLNQFGVQTMANRDGASVAWTPTTPSRTRAAPTR